MTDKMVPFSQDIADEEEQTQFSWADLWCSCFKITKQASIIHNDLNGATYEKTDKKLGTQEETASLLTPKN